MRATKAAEIKKRETRYTDAQSAWQPLKEARHSGLWTEKISKPLLSVEIISTFTVKEDWNKHINGAHTQRHLHTHTHRWKLPSLNPSRSHIYTASIERNDFEDLRHRWARPCEDWFFIHSFGSFFSRNNNRVSFCGFVYFSVLFWVFFMCGNIMCIRVFRPCVTAAEMWAVY